MQKAGADLTSLNFIREAVLSAVTEAESTYDLKDLVGTKKIQINDVPDEIPPLPTSFLKEDGRLFLFLY